MRASDRAWVVLGAAIVAYELAAKPEELMSEAVDRYLEARPWITRLGVTVIAAHLLNLIPPQYDPLHRLAVMTTCKINLRMVSELRRQKAKRNPVPVAFMRHERYYTGT